jgi:hypothetical protein
MDGRTDMSSRSMVVRLYSGSCLAVQDETQMYVVGMTSTYGSLTAFICDYPSPVAVVISLVPE